MAEDTGNDRKDLGADAEVESRADEQGTPEVAAQGTPEAIPEGRLRSAILSSARRRLGRRGGGLLPWLAVLALLLVGVSFELRWRAYRPMPAVPAPKRRATPLPAATPLPTVTATPTPQLISTGWQVVSAPTATPFPSPLPRPTRSRRGPQPTPTIEECVEYTWSASENRAALGQVLVDIEVRNQCQRQLEGLEVWFWIGGYREGNLAGSTHGHLYDPVRPGSFEHALIALPGSLTWFDHIEVRLIEPGTTIP